MKKYDPKITKPEDVPGLMIDGYAHVIARSENAGTFPCRYYNRYNRPVWWDIEQDTEVSSVTTWWEYPDGDEDLETFISECYPISYPDYLAWTRWLKELISITRESVRGE